MTITHTDWLISIQMNLCFMYCLCIIMMSYVPPVSQVQFWHRYVLWFPGRNCESPLWYEDARGNKVLSSSCQSMAHQVINSYKTVSSCKTAVPGITSTVYVYTAYCIVVETFCFVKWHAMFWPWSQFKSIRYMLTASPTWYEYKY